MLDCTDREKGIIEEVKVKRVFPTFFFGLALLALLAYYVVSKDFATLYKCRIQQQRVSSFFFDLEHIKKGLFSLVFLDHQRSFKGLMDLIYLGVQL